MADLAENLRGAVLMTASMAAFTINDTFIKSLAEDLPLMQTVFLRGLAATPLLALMAWWRGALRFRMARRDAGLLALRSLTEILAALFFLTALYNMPLANATAILQAAPLMVTLAGALFFGEAIGIWRMSAILVGFAGVLLIVQPGGDGFTSYSIWALAAVVAVVARDVLTRKMSGALPSLTVATVTAFSVGAAAGLVALFEPWVPVSGPSALALSGSVISILFAYLFSVTAVRVGDMGFVAPFRYTGLVWALVLGFLAFGDFPGPLTLLGSAVVIGAGLFTYLRERRLSIRRREISQAPPR
ncbi:DMT family transporter [Vannielia litorea]|uniref:DMT family transporter n=1 Tax=Vannielia litorea TaxID=1217970 RepID=UPI001C95F794|nr:DMT family transporter [Vannielia litorea]MBY6049614.1 DMT family transporter [Vannielia litorea]MBY6077028.1 DMT family transporter [Vannielia litorea]